MSAKHESPIEAPAVPWALIVWAVCALLGGVVLYGWFFF